MPIAEQLPVVAIRMNSLHRVVNAGLAALFAILPFGAVFAQTQSAAEQTAIVIRAIDVPDGRTFESYLSDLGIQAAVYQPASGCETAIPLIQPAGVAGAPEPLISAGFADGAVGCNLGAIEFGLLRPARQISIRFYGASVDYRLSPSSRAERFQAVRASGRFGDFSNPVSLTWTGNGATRFWFGAPNAILQIKEIAVTYDDAAPPPRPAPQANLAEQRFRSCADAQRIASPPRLRVEARYPVPPEGDPARALIPNHRDYAVNASCPCLGPVCTEKTMQLNVTIDPGSLPDAVQSVWRSAQVVGGSEHQPNLFLDVSDGPVRQCLPQGDYQVVVRSKIPDGCISQSDQIEIDDKVIVVLGDSYSAGEGAPIGRSLPTDIATLTPGQAREAMRFGFAAGLWANSAAPLSDEVFVDRLIADLSDPNTDEDVTDQPLFPFKQPANNLSFVPVLARFIDLDALPLETRLHYQSHRSPFASTSQLAMLAEEADDTTSITYANFAVTGGTIDLGIRAPSKIAESENSFEQTQLRQLSDMFEGRKIDALFIGFGGNEGGFARILQSMVLRDPELQNLGFDLKFEDIRESIYSGIWRGIETAYQDEPRVAGLGCSENARCLPNEYEFLRAQLQTILSDNNIDVGQIFLLGYPDPTLRLDDGVAESCAFFGNIRNRHSVLDRAFETGEIASAIAALAGRPDVGAIAGAILQFAKRVDLEIAGNEAQWARNEYLGPLDRIMREAADDDVQPWTYVPMPRSVFEGHGICAERPYNEFQRFGFRPRLDFELGNTRWFRDDEEAFALQSSFTKKFDKGRGLGHPNEDGHLAMALVQRDALLANGQEAGIPFAKYEMRLLSDGKGLIDLGTVCDGSAQLVETPVELRLTSLGDVENGIAEFSVEGNGSVSVVRSPQVQGAGTFSFPVRVDCALDNGRVTARVRPKGDQVHVATLWTDRIPVVSAPPPNDPCANQIPTDIGQDADCGPSAPQESVFVPPPADWREAVDVSRRAFGLAVNCDAPRVTPLQIDYEVRSSLPDQLAGLTYSVEPAISARVVSGRDESRPASIERARVEVIPNCATSSPNTVAFVVRYAGADGEKRVSTRIRYVTNDTIPGAPIDPEPGPGPDIPTQFDTGLE